MISMIKDETAAKMHLLLWKSLSANDDLRRLRTAVLKFILMYDWLFQTERVLGERLKT